MARDYKAEEARRNARSRAAGFTSRAQERRIRAESDKWSKRHASQDIAKWKPGRDPKYAKAYYDAFVNPKTSFKSLRKGKTTTPEIYHYFVDVMKYMTAAEYDQKYGAYVDQWIYSVKCKAKDGFSKKFYFDEEDAQHAAERHYEIRGQGHVCTITRVKA